MSRIAILLCVLLLIAMAAQGQIQPSFFSMGAANPFDMPKVGYGTLSHPPVAWTAVEGVARGTFDFSKLDGFVRRAPRDVRNNVAYVTIVLGWTPGWAVADQTHCFRNRPEVIACTVPPDNIQDWIDFVTALVAHYDGKNFPHVRYYEIWNEASNTLFWTKGPPAMVQLAQAAYPILKSDPFAIVLTPSVVWTNGVPFMKAYLKGGGGQYADALAFHGYPSLTGPGKPLPVPLPESPNSTNAPIQDMIATFRALADANGMLGKPLVTTEGGWGTNGVSDPDMQTAWITHYEILQAGLASSNNLTFQTWYTWGQAFSGTIEDSEGAPTAAGAAYDVVRTWLVGQQVSPCTSNGNIWSCQAGGNLIVWDTSQACSAGACTTASYIPPAGYTSWTDVTGAVLPVQGSIDLGVKPVMLQP